MAAAKVGPGTGQNTVLPAPPPRLHSGAEGARARRVGSSPKSGNGCEKALRWRAVMTNVELWLSGLSVETLQMFATSPMGGRGRSEPSV